MWPPQLSPCLLDPGLSCLRLFFNLTLVPSRCPSGYGDFSFVPPRRLVSADARRAASCRRLRGEHPSSSWASGTPLVSSSLTRTVPVAPSRSVPSRGHRPQRPERVAPSPASQAGGSPPSRPSAQPPLRPGLSCLRSDGRAPSLPKCGHQPLTPDPCRPASPPASLGTCCHRVLKGVIAHRGSSIRLQADILPPSPSISLRPSSSPARGRPSRSDVRDPPRRGLRLAPALSACAVSPPGRAAGVTGEHGSE